MFVLRSCLAGLALTCTGILPVQAASVPQIAVQAFDPSTRDAAVDGFHASLVEDFESFTQGELGGPLATSVGSFTTLGGTGSGATVTGTAGNTGTGLYVRDGATFGRSNTTAGGSNFLDSNDTYGVEWLISGLGLFDRLFFTLSDITDSGAAFTLSAAGSEISFVQGARGNGAVDFVMLSFDRAISDLIVTFRNTSLNDGFGIDDVGVALSAPVSAVPLPSSVLMLLAGTAALMGLGRHRARRRPSVA